MPDTTDQEREELEAYDSLETNPLINSGLAGEIEAILRGYEPVANGLGEPLGFDLQKDERTEDGFYWEFEDIANAAKKIADWFAARDAQREVEIVHVEHRDIGGHTYTCLYDAEGNKYLKLEKFDMGKSWEPKFGGDAKVSVIADSLALKWSLPAPPLPKKENE